MKYVSVCAGIEAATVAWHPLGWEPVLFAEIEPFPRAVLRHHYPDVPLVGDFTELIFNPPVADLLVGGTPCQAFSMAGKRLSLEDYRGNLSLAFADLFHAGRYRWAVWENVPGVLSTKDNAFGSLLGRLVGSDTPLLPHRGGKWTNAGVVSGPQATAAWRVLDAQYFGVAQRRRRVFVCVSRGAGFECARALLPVGESLSRHPPARPQAGQNIAADAGTGVARSLRGQPNHTHRADSDDNVVGMTLARSKTAGQRYDSETENFVVERGGEWPATLAPTLNAHFGEKQGLEDQHINGGAGMFVLGAVPQVLRNREGKAGGGKGPLLSENLSLTLATTNDQVVFPIDSQNGLGLGPDHSTLGVGEPGDPSFTLGRNHHHGVVAPTLSASNDPSRVSVTHAALRPRRLTPTECARLQGFPDRYLLDVPWKGKPTPPDGPMYKAYGNSMAVPVMAWIGKRIQCVEEANA